MSDRHQIRANWHDYNDGIYFVTICCASKLHYFGEILDGEMHLSEIGVIAEQCINQIDKHHKFTVEVLHHVIMPNHIHMVISIDNENPAQAQQFGTLVGAQYIAPALAVQSASENKVNIGAIRPPAHGEPCGDNHFNSGLAIVVRTFKAAVSRMVASSRRAQNIAPLPIWQRNYYEHIIRNQQAFDKIMLYIDENVERWNSDYFNN